MVCGIRLALLSASALTFLPEAAASSPAVGTVASDSTEKFYDISAGPLRQAVDRFAQRALIELSIEGEIEANLLSTGIKGRHSIGSALGILLTGSGFEAVNTGPAKYVLRRQRTSHPNAATLQTVTVVAHSDGAPKTYAGGQLSRSASAGLLGTQDLLDTPFASTAYTESFIRDRQATDIGGVIGAADASVYVAQKRGIREAFLLRGFNVDGLNDVYFNGLAGMAPMMRGSTEMAERIDVQKGPATLLRGMTPDGSVGGSINLIPKRAGATPLARMTASYESDSVLGIHADVGRRFGEHQQFGIRVNGVSRGGDTAVDDQRHKAALGALALDWRGDRVRLSADLYRQRERLDGVNYFGISTIADSVKKMPSALSGGKNLAPPWAFSINTSTAAMARAEWDVTNALTAYAAYGRRDGSYDTLITSSSLANDAGEVRTTAVRQYYNQVVHSGEAGLNGKFATGSVDHLVSLVATAYKAEWGATSARAAAATTNINNLNYGAKPNFSSFSTATPDMLLRTELNSVAIADRMSMLDDRLQLTVGVRHQKVGTTPLNTYARTFTGYGEGAWSPMAAVLFKPRDSLSIYGSYIQGLSQGGTAPATAANANQPLPPLKTEQYEVGMKHDWGSFAATAALFEITRPSAYTNPVTNVYAASGEQRNRGAEFNLFGEVARGMRLIGGLSFTEATLRKQLNPAHNGKQAAGTPKFVLRLGAEYDLPSLPGLTLTGHVNQVSKRYVTPDNRFSAVAFATLDVGARYATSIGGKPVTLRASVANLFDKAYWTGTLGSGLGSPRTILVSSSVDF